MGLYYCVALTTSPTTRSVLLPSPPASILPTATPTGCADTWFVALSDTCASVARANHVSVAQLVAMNPGRGLLGVGDPEASCALPYNTFICVAMAPSSSSSGSSTYTGIFVGGPPTYTPSSSVSSTTDSTSTIVSSTTSAASGVSTPLPTQAGMVSDCMPEVSSLSL